MLIREIRSQVDRISDAFWSGGISNPLEVMEQITYLPFLKRLDDIQTAAENKASGLGQPIEQTIFPAGKWCLAVVVPSRICDGPAVLGPSATEALRPRIAKFSSIGSASGSKALTSRHRTRRSTLR